MFNIDNSRESANFINNISNDINELNENTEADLDISLFRGLAEGWREGQAAIHVHARVRLVGKTVADNLCWIFMRKFNAPHTLFKQDSFGVPTDNPVNVSSERQLHAEGSVLIHIGQSSNRSEATCFNGDAEVRLRLLNDCPRIPINLYPIKNAALWLFLSELDFLQECFLSVHNWELIERSWPLTVSKDKLPNEVVKATSEIMEKISCNESEPIIHLRERLNRYNIPRAITPYIENSVVGVLFNPDITIRFENVEVLFGPAEFRPNTCKICRSNGHILYYPYGEENGKETKDSKGARNTRAHKERIPRQSKKGSKAEQVNASKPEEVKSQTLSDPRSGGYTAKNTHSGSLEDV